ncbi:thiol reductant ABC exporter subunit CydC [Leucobacter triazinivorans]|uniref:Thiol reductant ABC exporter subunit CydC n=1 Tax=Leucobacter triazinivorans TaxID=1784719 RepID=A0A4P6KHQ5_9MICO|nr:thiol reductant ABC exporter subunit CydC [Leucobacter triazinivorans]QBE50085.1 thiol reductant ABC exporter subunit CydC [Leucobacter triazinivorans]
MSATRTTVRSPRRAVLARAMPDRRRRLPGLLLGVLSDVCVVGLLGLSMWLIVRAAEQPPILHLTFAIVGVRALAIGRAAFRYAERLFSHDAALAQLASLRAQTFDALVPRVPGAIESHRRGEVLAAFVDDVDQLQDEPLRVRQPLIVSAVVVALSVVLVSLISPLGGAVLLAMLLLSGGVSVLLAGRMAGAYDRDLSEARAALVDALLERFAAAEVLAAYGALPQQRRRIDAAEQRLSAVQVRRSRSTGLTGALLALGAGLASLLVFALLLPQLDTAGLSAPLFAAVVVVPAAVFEVFAQVPAAIAARRAVAASADRVAALTGAALPSELVVDPVVDPVASDADASQRFDDSQARLAHADPSAPLIAVRDLAVRHPGAARDAVQGVGFALRAGETLVVTGESGAGKSTLALALVRFLAYRGSYRLRGIEADQLSAVAVRREVGLCEQTPHLFDADLRQNLKFARETATDDELLAVLDRVGLGEWARDRGGLDAPVGEHGSLVSGGQAQRIALARAILADFPVVVLDEPTAGVDRELADRLIVDLLGAVPADRAVILITHTDLPPGITATRLRL